MAEITRLPSTSLREFITSVAADGQEVERRVVAFVVGTRQVLHEFSAELDPLALSDSVYERITASCGLDSLLVAAERMRATLGDVTLP